MALIEKKHEMPVQAPEIRAHNFSEVALGYDEQTALSEASRCLNCKNRPCVEGCPVNIHIPEFIAKVKEKNYEEAYRIISLTSSLPAVCGRICPHDCESECTRGRIDEPVSIDEIKKFIADKELDA